MALQNTRRIRSNRCLMDRHRNPSMSQNITRNEKKFLVRIFSAEPLMSYQVAFCCDAFSHCFHSSFTVNPITQKYTDKDMETLVQGLEASAKTKVLNQAWDKQIQREAHFDILTQHPKRGHIHEVLSHTSYLHCASCTPSCSHVAKRIARTNRLRRCCLLPAGYVWIRRLRHWRRCPTFSGSSRLASSPPTTADITSSLPSVQPCPSRPHLKPKPSRARSRAAPRRPSAPSEATAAPYLRARWDVNLAAAAHGRGAESNVRARPLVPDGRTSRRRRRRLRRRRRQPTTSTTGRRRGGGLNVSRPHRGPRRAGVGRVGVRRAREGRRAS